MTPVFISNNMGMVRGWTARAPMTRDGQQHVLVQCPLDLDEGERVTLTFSSLDDGAEMEAEAVATPAGVPSGYWLRIVGWRVESPLPPGLVRQHDSH